ncbi:MAG: matrixin family metalloprotease [Planctomycetes bacterium]|nr:matrixin family metalloprotease [Planctomycetota bacterium]
MRLTSFLLPVAAIGGAFWMLSAPRSVGYSLIGGSLGLSQRDVRVFDNFTDSTANNNTTPDANFPGYTGCEMAIWKGALEWGSELHGNGNGDPHQNGGLGSGSANFDPSWQGNTTSGGGNNDNIVSAIAGDSSGVLAYTLTPISDGWTIKFYDNAWNWDDGPGTTITGIDLQGVMCHEYGHALGLGHSNVGGSTMFPSISGNGIAARSIAADDIAGIQAIYGVKSATKPRITNVSVNGTAVTISGTNFSATGNEVWFTKTGTGGNGDPIKLTGVTSSGGTISVTAPASAGDGDVLVRNNGTGNANLSNAWPIDIGAAPPGCGVTSLSGLPGNTGVLSTASTPTQGATMTFSSSGLVITGVARRIIGFTPTNQFVLQFTLLVDYTTAVSLAPFTLVNGAGSFTATMPPLPGTTIYVQAVAPQSSTAYIGTNRLNVAICP